MWKISKYELRVDTCFSPLCGFICEGAVTRCNFYMKLQCRRQCWKNSNNANQVTLPRHSKRHTTLTIVVPSTWLDWGPLTTYLTAPLFVVNLVLLHLPASKSTAAWKRPPASRQILCLLRTDRSDRPYWPVFYFPNPEENFKSETY